jgi:hypothetical protein
MDQFEIELAQQSEQGSQMWTDIRAGRFTSSEMWKLMLSGTREMTEAELKARPKTGKGSKTKFVEDPACLSDQTITYIYSKVAESLTGQAAEPVNSQATRWGDDMEPFAAEYFREKTGLDYDIISFVPFGDHAGGSPDRVIKGTKDILEIKCPFNSANQIHYLMLTDQWDLKRQHPEHYWQCMSNLLFMDAPICHFVTYDHRMKDEKEKLFYLPIKPVSEDFERIVKKLEVAITEKLAILKIIREQKATLTQLEMWIELQRKQTV